VNAAGLFDFGAEAQAACSDHSSRWGDQRGCGVWTVGFGRVKDPGQVRGACALFWTS